MGLHCKLSDEGSQLAQEGVLDLREPEARADRLRAWLGWYGYTYADLARILGLSRQMVCRIARANRAPAHRIEQLASLGIPRDLLPMSTKGDPETDE